MRRLSLALVILIASAAPAWATSITSTASGNWASGGTWVGGVAPVAGDTAIIAVGHTVTVAASTSAACANLTLNASGSTSGFLIIDTSATLTITNTAGADSTVLTVVGGTSLGTLTKLTMNAGASLIVDPGGAHVASIMLGSGNYMYPRWLINGTSGSHCTVRQITGGTGTVKIIPNTNSNVMAFMTAAYCDFINLGSATVDAIIGYGRDYAGVACDFSFDHCTFQSCGRIYGVLSGTGSNTQNAVASITNCTWTNSLDTNHSPAESLRLFACPNTGSGTRAVTGNIFDKMFTFQNNGGPWTITGNVFGGWLSINSPTTATNWGTFSGNFLVDPYDGTNPLPLCGNLTNNYFWQKGETFWNWHVAAGPGTTAAVSPSGETYSGNIFEASCGGDSTSPTATSNPDGLMSNGVGTANVSVLNNLFLPGPANNGSGVIWHEGIFGTSGASTRIEHNTCFGVGGANSPYFGEWPQGNATGMYSSYRANLVWCASGAKGMKLDSDNAYWNLAPYNSGAQATVNVTGGGSSGGSLAAGNYYVAYTYIDWLGNESTTGYGTPPSTTSAQITVASGNIPQVTISALPSWAVSANIYLTLVGGANTAVKKYLTGVTGTTANLSAASGGSVAPPANIGDPTDAVSAAMCDYNAGYNCLGGASAQVYLNNQVTTPTQIHGYGNLRFSGSTAPGTHDVDEVDPGFVDKTRSLATWYTSPTGANQSATGTYMGDCNAAVTYLSANPSQIASLISWVKAGFAPTASQYNTTYSGDTNAVQNIGAILGQFGPTTATLAGPSPASGSLGVLSGAYTVTLNTAALTGGQVVYLASSVATDWFYGATGGNVTSITIAAGNTTGTFYVLPKGSIGARTITPTSSGVTFTPATRPYAAAVPGGVPIMIPMRAQPTRRKAG